MMDRVRGRYAIVIRGEVRKGLLLSRASFGIEPLYCADDGKTLRCASQVKGLLAGGAVAIRPRPAGPGGVSGDMSRSLTPGSGGFGPSRRDRPGARTGRETLKRGILTPFRRNWSRLMRPGSRRASEERQFGLSWGRGWW
jgi:asparagine synthetase B (glutamine-hydrolysing)